jgi:hypothetical protein
MPVLERVEQLVTPRRRPAASTLDPSRWEHGSDFHWCSERGTLDAPWTVRPHTLWGSGRDALRALLGWGRERHGWRRVLVPTFFCPDVVEALSRELAVEVYPDSPLDPSPRSIDASERDVVLVVNPYGMRASTRIETRGLLVEDHTHDPLSAWAVESEAEYAIASLRKTLPLPDGGVLWSPRGRALPPERAATRTHLRAALDRLAGMVLKRRYLDGEDVAKAAFRAAATRGQRRIGAGEISGITPLSRAVLPTLPGQAWRRTRGKRLAAFRDALGQVTGARLLDAPFAATLLFDTPEGRERVRRALLQARIYPAVLWSLEERAVTGLPARHVDLSRRVLSLHCDFRYTDDDMRRVAATVRGLLH